MPSVDCLKAMIISRGHGRGHAVPDMAIATELLRLFPKLQLQYASYAAGAEAYKAAGYDVLDLQLEDNPPFLDMIVACTKLLSEERPRLVIAHEEIAAVPIAKALGIPCILVTDFFTDPGSVPMKALQDAAEVVFLGQRGLFTEPPYLRGKVSYVGRAVRPFEYTLADRERARCELSIASDAALVLCQPGAWVESQVPLADLLSAAWDLLPHSPKRLIWLAGRDYGRLAARFSKYPEITILKEDWKLDRLMSASDVLITKGNRVTVFESAFLGLPSISLSTLVNWPDDVAISGVDSNTALRIQSVTPQALADLIVAQTREKPRPAVALSGGITGAANRVAHHLNLLLANRPDE